LPDEQQSLSAGVFRCRHNSQCRLALQIPLALSWLPINITLSSERIASNAGPGLPSLRQAVMFSRRQISIGFGPARGLFLCEAYSLKQILLERKIVLLLARQDVCAVFWQREPNHSAVFIRCKAGCPRPEIASVCHCKKRISEACPNLMSDFPLHFNGKKQRRRQL
jgi:hypothetical protein